MLEDSHKAGQAVRMVGMDCRLFRRTDPDTGFTYCLIQDTVTDLTG